MKEKRVTRDVEVSNKTQLTGKFGNTINLIGGGSVWKHSFLRIMGLTGGSWRDNVNQFCMVLPPKPLIYTYKRCAFPRRLFRITVINTLKCPSTESYNIYKS